MEYQTTIKRGKAFERLIRRRNRQSGELQNFTDCTVRGQMRHPAEAEPVDFLITLQTDTTTATPNAVIHFRIGATTTKNLRLGRWSFDIEVVPPSGEDDTFEAIRGTINVVGETTQ